MLYCISFRLSLPFYVYFRHRSFRFVSLQVRAFSGSGFTLGGSARGSFCISCRFERSFLRLSFRPQWRVPPGGSPFTELGEEAPPVGSVPLTFVLYLFQRAGPPVPGSRGWYANQMCFFSYLPRFVRTNVCCVASLFRSGISMNTAMLVGIVVKQPDAQRAVLGKRNGHCWKSGRREASPPLVRRNRSKRLRRTLPL